MRYFALPLLALMPLAPAFAQTTGAESGSEAEETDEIVVVAERYPGQVNTPQPPILELNEEEIASYGVASLTELIDALSPQVSSGRGRGSGRPIMLINGQRVSSFREMRNFPPEAIRKVEVLPEEVALRYGYPANQRVVNFILKPNFTSKTVDVEYEMPTRGHTADAELKGSMLNINGPRRFNLTAELNDTSMLTEAERNLRQPTGNIPTVPGDLDPARYRSLIADSRDLTLEGNWSTGLGKEGQGGQLSLNGAFTRSDSRSLAGLNMVRLTDPDGNSELRSLPGALTRNTRTDTLSAGGTLNKAFGGWQFTATVDGSHAVTTTQIDERADVTGLVTSAAAGLLDISGPLPSVLDGGRDESRVTSDSLSNKITMAGRAFTMPAGDVSLTASAGFDYTGLNSRDTRVSGRTKLDRKDVNAGVNIGIPIASTREGVLDAIGDLSLNFSGGINHLSDFGTLTNWNTGLTWSPTKTLTFQASYIVEDAAPGLTDLGNPLLQTFNVPVYDFTRGETALVTVMTGGNPDLKKEKQRDIKVSATWQLPFLSRSNFMVEYFRNSSNDVTSSFPVLTPAIEAAFPDRVIRDESGRLVSVDRRPVTYDKMKSSRLRYGFNLSGELGKANPAAGGGRGPGGFGGGPGGFGGGPGGGGPGGGDSGGPRGERSGGGAGGPGGGERMGAGPGGPGGPMMGGRGGNGRGRWNLSIYHTVRFDETVTIARGGPVLDLLHGDALTDGGVARHAIEVEGGTFYRGFGLRLKGTYSAPVHVKGDELTGSSDLRFGSTFVANLRIFADLGQQKRLVDASPFFKGTRISFKIDNLFDSRQKVTDGSGVIPLSYQRDYRDPKGRVIGIDIRKMF